MTGKHQRRAAANEATIRDVNEGIERGQWPGEEDSPVGFRCECARLGCNRLIELSVHEYEEIRANPRRFVLLPGHEFADIETVIETRPGYIIVEKRDEAAEVAEENNPRG
ncbi:MAG: hypothetical protein JO286_23420 [Solirubrobacterales bacterium]|nr:hypothetical protein [Solirubrobacterales bacterium]MBV9366772.1 hypothetical protein [Solirubrobacterales bacterium]MBV9683354.1 hypothetical protein [Solirubrobacterales bacterium]MBV9810146.1 hypothetical protein [Solirubrobacterales bacterium]